MSKTTSRAPRTLTAAQAAQPAAFQPVDRDGTRSTARIPSYRDLYEASTALREPPALRLQRIAEQDPGLAPGPSIPA